MENTTKEIFNIDLEILTPIHIGSGNKVPKTELAYFPNKKIIRKIDLDKFFESQPPHKIREISEKLRYAKNDYFNNILKAENLSLENLNSEYDLNLSYDYNSDDINRIREIDPFVKTPFFKPYIPGSSIKGWLRTAILYYYIKRIKEFKGVLDEINDKLDYLPRNYYRLRKEKVRFAKIIENKIFGSDPKEDIFRFLIISDTHPESYEHLNLSLVQIFHPTKVHSDIQFQSLKFSQYLETLKKNTRFSGRILFSKDLETYKNEYLQYDTLSTKIRNFILKDFIELSREDCFKKLCRISNIFSKNILEYNFEYLKRLSKEIKSESLKNLIQYYNSELFPLYDKLTESNNEFLLRLGAGTDWHSKTIGLEIIDYFLKNKGMNFNDFYDRINRLQLFKGKMMHNYFEFMPISRKYILDEFKNPQFPLGWVKGKLIAR